MTNTIHNSGVARILLALIVVAMAPISQAARKSPTITFERKAVMVAGLTAKKEVLLFGISNEVDRVPRRISYKAAVFAVRDDGTFRLDQPNAIPAESAWIAVDMTTADYCVASPAGLASKVSKLPAAVIRSSSSQVPAHLEGAFTEQQVLVIRPDVGAWQSTDGGLELQALTAIGASPAAPADFAKGDLILTVDPFTLRVRTLVVH